MVEVAVAAAAAEDEERGREALFLVGAGAAVAAVGVWKKSVLGTPCRKQMTQCWIQYMYMSGVSEVGRDRLSLQRLLL